MSFSKFILFSAFGLLFLACGGEKNPAKIFSIKIEGNKKVFQQNDLLDISIDSKDKMEVSEVVYSIDGHVLPNEGDKLKLEVDKLGNKLLRAEVQYEDNSFELTKKIRVLSESPPELYTYEIINEYPHDIEAFTQGLEFHGDFLYEGTGRNGISSLRRTKFETGEVLVNKKLDYNYFGEGITIIGDTIYQLTWQNKTGFIYDTESMERIGSFQYGQSKEGWGLCNDGKVVYKSDGTEKIWMLNKNTLAEEGYLEIVTNKSLFNKANELEYVNGKIYANVWQKESMMIIDAGSGAIIGVVNLSGLKEKVRQHNKLDVLNGIAYHPERKTFFVTGKNWNKLFEIRIFKK